MTIIGALLILGASCAVSFCLIREGAGKVTALEAVCRLIMHIKQNIETFGTPIDGILECYSSEYFEKSCFADEMRKNGIAHAASCGRIALREDAKTEFKAFAENIGKGYRDEEIRRCEYYLSLFEGYLSEEKDRLKRYSPMYRYLPPLAAMSLIIIVL